MGRKWELRPVQLCLNSLVRVAVHCADRGFGVTDLLLKPCQSSAASAALSIQSWGKSCYRFSLTVGEYISLWQFFGSYSSGKTVFLLHSGLSLVAHWTAEPGPETYFRNKMFVGLKTKGESMENWSQAPLKVWTTLRELVSS